MSESRNLKLRLIERFTPLLYLSADEPDLPVDPVDYVEHAALWASTPPEHPKSGWGVAAPAGRRPLIERGDISLENGFPFTPTSTVREPWLDLAAWRDAEQVSQATRNHRTHDRARPELRQPWFTADVWSAEQYLGDIGEPAAVERFGIGLNDQVDQLSNVIVVAFHFLFPLHRQPRRRTARPAQQDEYTGDFEGDWSTFAVVARTFAGPASVVGAVQVTPLYGAFGQRWRGTTADHPDHATSRMFLVPWSELLTSAEHPIVVAAPGTHNLYPHHPPLDTNGNIDLQWVDMGKSASEPANDFVNDLTEEPWSPVMAVKVLAGFAVGGPIGAFVGALAAAAESSAAEKEGLFDPPKLSAEPKPHPDDPLTDDAEDLAKKNVVAPVEVAAAPLVDPDESQLFRWSVSPSESLIDDNLPFLVGERPSFQGRWGVRCTDDPFLIRSGLAFSDQKAEVIDALLRFPHA